MGEKTDSKVATPYSAATGCWDFHGNDAWGVRAEWLRLDDGLGHFLKDDRNAFDIQGLSN